MKKLAANAMDRHGFMTDKPLFGTKSLSELRSAKRNMGPLADAINGINASQARLEKQERLKLVNPNSKLHLTEGKKRTLDEIKHGAYSKAVSKGKGVSIGNPTIKDYVFRNKTASTDYNFMDKVAANAMDRHGFMTDKRMHGDTLNTLRADSGKSPVPSYGEEAARGLANLYKKDRIKAVNPNSNLRSWQPGKKRTLDEIKNAAYEKAVFGGKIRQPISAPYGHPNQKVRSYMERSKVASADYEEMVKMAYEEIIDSLEK